MFYFIHLNVEESWKKYEFSKCFLCFCSGVNFSCVRLKNFLALSSINPNLKSWWCGGHGGHLNENLLLPLFSFYEPLSPLLLPSFPLFPLPPPSFSLFLPPPLPSFFILIPFPLPLPSLSSSPSFSYLFHSLFYSSVSYTFPLSFSSSQSTSLLPILCFVWRSSLLLSIPDKSVGACLIKSA